MKTLLGQLLRGGRTQGLGGVGGFKVQALGLVVFLRTGCTIFVVPGFVAVDEFSILGLVESGLEDW